MEKIEKKVKKYGRPQLMIKSNESESESKLCDPHRRETCAVLQRGNCRVNRLV